MNGITVNFYKNKWVHLSVLWFILGVFLIFSIPPRRGDPLHYLSVAWGMYKNHVYLATFSGGHLDLEKTPLFYWPIVGGWHVFGVNNIWPFVYTYLIGWVDLIFTAWLAKQLFKNPRITWFSVFILVSSLYWPLYFQDIRFEGLLVFFGLLFLNFAIKAGVSQKNVYWILSAVTFGFCTFSKGPVSFLYYLPIALCLPLLVEIQHPKRWYLSLILAMLCGLVIPLSWIYFLFVQYGWKAIHYLLFEQISQRVGTSFTIIYFFLPLCRAFVNMFPWAFIYAFYILRYRKIERNKLLLWSILIVQALFFGAFVERQALHYLIPLFPFMAILMAECLQKYITEKECWIIGCLFLLVFALFQATIRSAKYQSLEPIAKQLKLIENTGAPIVQFDLRPGYHNFEFLGRLEKEIPIVVGHSSQKEWLKTHASGWVIRVYDTVPKKCHFSEQWPIDKKSTMALATSKEYSACL